jgi:hypothetical protein
MAAKVGTQLENINSLRKYPFSEGATLISDSGEDVPVNIVTGLSITSFVDCGTLHFSYIYVGPSIITVVISDNARPVLISTHLNDPAGYSAQMESLVDGINGSITIGQHNETLYGKSYRFSSDRQSGIHRFCILEFPRTGVIEFVDDVSGERVRGDVALSFSSGIKASVEPGDDNKTKIVLSMPKAVSNGLSSGCVPTDLNSACVAPVIQTINGISPTEYGEIAIVLE